MTSLPFVKVEGLGNDFVVLDVRPGRSAASMAKGAITPGLARALCDRRFGVGADGVLAILPGLGCDARMIVMNADGSRAEMCGNGLRCVAKLLYERDPDLRRPFLRIDTNAGILECTLEVRGQTVESVAVDMGRPRLARAEIPLATAGPEPVVREAITALDRQFRLTAVSMGNPHAVIFWDDPAEDLRHLAELYGPAIETSPAFPNRANVEMARVSTTGIDVVVWERGAGITMACGTGACATAVAASLEERLRPGAEVAVRLPGGTLHITVAPQYAGVRMRGPARVVYEGEYHLSP